MSAINGIFAKNCAFSTEELLTASFVPLHWFGAGASRRWVNNAVGLGFYQRHAIEAGSQANLPFFDRAARLAITADVRLDNRVELCAVLAVPLNAALTDSQLILLAWQKWGRNCPHYLMGDFAFALWDEPKHLLFCARDHVGVRPFYYCHRPDLFVFASDLKSVLAVPGVPDQLDEEYLAASLLDKFFYQVDRTYFCAVRKLPPGHSLTITVGREKLERYWPPANLPDIRFANDDEYADAAREIYTQAVSVRLQSAHRVGVHLSGGLDSSSLAVLAARELRRQGQAPPAVFCWQPPPTSETTASSEFKWIEAVCQQENLTTQYCPMTVEDALTVLKKDPTNDAVTSTLLIESTIQRAAEEQGVRVILSGWGGDEGLSCHGNGFYSQLLLQGRWKKLFSESQAVTVRPWRFILREALLLPFPDRSSVLNKIAQRSFRSQVGVNSLLHPGLVRQAKKLRSMPWRESGIRESLNWSWTNGHLAERMESWHASGMRHGITYAYPMLDRRLLEFVAGLPPEQFIRGKWKRWIMRTAMAGILPQEMCWHQDKSDPVRVEQAIATIQKTLGIVGEQLAQATTAPSRARYLDMPRLREQLRPEVLAQNQRLGDLLRAVQFLDF